MKNLSFRKTIEVVKLPPSMRSRKRYIAFKLITEKNLDEKDVEESVIRTLTSLFGEISTMECDVKLEKFDGKKGILRCNLDALEKVMIAITLLDRVEDENVALLTVGISGTLRGCEKKLEVLT